MILWQYDLICIISTVHYVSNMFAEKIDTWSLLYLTQVFKTNYTIS